MAEFNRKKKKVCVMCTGKTIDWKDAETLKNILTKKVRFYHVVLLEIVQNIKDLYLNKLREHVQLHYYHIQNKCRIIYIFFIEKFRQKTRNII